MPGRRHWPSRSTSSTRSLGKITQTRGEARHKSATTLDGAAMRRIADRSSPAGVRPKGGELGVAADGSSSASSIVRGSMLCPPRMIRSLARPTRCMNSSGSAEARSPVSSHPSRSLSPALICGPFGPWVR